MLVKFMPHGRGPARGPINYLLGPKRDREHSRILRGDPKLIATLIDSTEFAQKYTSVVLSFEERGSALTDEQKQEIMSSFEQCLLPGIDPADFSVLWVEHTDKDRHDNDGRLELNAVFSTVHLPTEKRLQLYYHKIDKKRVNDWKDLINFDYGLSSPSDPSKKRHITFGKSNRPMAATELQNAVTQQIEELALSGQLLTRTDVLAELHEMAEVTGLFTVARETKNSISIKPTSGGKNVRLKGAAFEASFGESARENAGLQAAERPRRDPTDRPELREIDRPDRLADGRPVEEVRRAYQEKFRQRSAENQRNYRAEVRAAEPVEHETEADLLPDWFVGRLDLFGNAISIDEVRDVKHRTERTLRRAEQVAASIRINVASDRIARCQSREAEREANERNAQRQARTNQSADPSRSGEARTVQIVRESAAKAVQASATGKAAHIREPRDLSSRARPRSAQGSTLQLLQRAKGLITEVKRDEARRRAIRAVDQQLKSFHGSTDAVRAASGAARAACERASAVTTGLDAKQSKLASATAQVCTWIDTTARGFQKAAKRIGSLGKLLVSATDKIAHKAAKTAQESVLPASDDVRQPMRPNQPSATPRKGMRR